jgi:hypothetical protein
VQRFPVQLSLPNDVHHEFTYWVGCRMTMDEWIALDNALDEAFESVLGPDADVTGVAGPIPFEASGEGSDEEGAAT